MYSPSEVVALLVIFFIWAGAAILAGLLMYLRAETRGMGGSLPVILIDSLLIVAGLIVLAATVPLIRIVGGGSGLQPALSTSATVSRFISLGCFVLIVWLPDLRLFRWLSRNKKTGVPS